MARYSKEIAIQVLEKNLDIPEGLKEYFGAIRDDTLPQYYLKELLIKRNDYSDETPPVDVRSLIPDSERLTRFKCQGNYVLGLCLTLKTAMEDGVVSDSGTKREIDQFLASDLNFKVGDPANQQRIGRINKVLNRLIGELGK